MLKVNQYRTILLEEFYIDSKGIIRRKTDGYLNRFSKDDPATFFIGADGYMNIQVPRKRNTIKKAHLVLLLSGVTLNEGEEVDHKDGNRLNDTFSNLRVVTRRINSCNRKLRTDNTSGHTGIRWSEYHQHYVIRRTVNGKRLSRSRKTLDEAIEVLEEMTKQDSAYTTRHGK